MEKGPSIYAEYWTSEYNEVNHFYSHGYDMGYTWITDYSQAAVDFIQSNSDTMMSFNSEDGTTYLYDPETNEFAMLSSDGKIITYFYPDRGIDYFNDLFAETEGH